MVFLVCIRIDDEGIFNLPQDKSPLKHRWHKTGWNLKIKFLLFYILAYTRTYIVTQKNEMKIYLFYYHLEFIN